MDSLITLLHSICPMSPPLVDHLRSILVFNSFSKKEHLLRDTNVASRIYYISRGLVRNYNISDGEEVSKWFMRDGDICISVRSFLRQQPSQGWIQALEPTETWSISYDQLEEIYKLFPEFNLHGRLITQYYYLWSEDTREDMLDLPTTEFYKRWIGAYPDLARRVPAKHLASFFNVSISTLVRIRYKHAHGGANN